MDIREQIEELRDYKCSSLPCCNKQNAAADTMEKLLAVVEEFANDTDDCVSPGMKVKALAALDQTRQGAIAEGNDALEDAGLARPMDEVVDELVPERRECEHPITVIGGRCGECGGPTNE